MNSLIQRDAVKNNILDQMKDARLRLDVLERTSIDRSIVVPPIVFDGVYVYGSTPSYPVTITGHGYSDIAPTALLQVVNPTDGVGTRYNGEAHIYIRAGLTQNERRYINFRKYDDTADDLILGCNASDVFILYDGTAHRLWFDKGGNSLFNAAGTGSINFGYHASDTTGTGGFAVYTGGAPAVNTRVFGVAVASGIDSQLTIDIRAGSASDQNAYLQFKNKSAASVYLLGKHNSNSFALYDSLNSEYAIWWDTTAKGLAIGHAIPAARLHPITIDAGTNAVVDVAILGHSTSDTPAAGFGTGLLFQAEDASVDKRAMGRLTFAWIDPTDASRAATGKLTAYTTTTEQTAIQWDGDSGGVKLGFYAATPVAKQTVTGSRGGNAALASLITAMTNLGFVIDSSS